MQAIAWSDNIAQDMQFQYAENINSYTDLNLIMGHVNKPIAPSITEQVQDIPGMFGNNYSGTDYGELTFNIPVTIMANDETEYNLSIENLRNVFTNDVDNQGTEFPIVFGDRPEVAYYGHWTSLPEPQFVNASDWVASVTLVFTCSKPYGYLHEQNGMAFNGGLPLFPQGNGKTYPIYTLHLKHDTAHIGLNDTTNRGYVAVGYDVDKDDTDDDTGNHIDNKEPEVCNETGESLDNWTYDQNEVRKLGIATDNDIAGTMSDYAGFGIAPGLKTWTDVNWGNHNHQATMFDYGDPTKHGDNFFGPMAVHQNFENANSYDWQLCVNLHNNKDMSNLHGSRAMGHLDCYLLDGNGNRCGKIWVHDWQHGRMTRFGIQLGSRENHVEIVNPEGNNSTIGPEYVTTPHGRERAWEDGHNETKTLYTWQSYKVYQGGKSYRKRVYNNKLQMFARRKGSKDRRRRTRRRGTRYRTRTRTVRKVVKKVVYKKRGYRRPRPKKTHYVTVHKNGKWVNKQHYTKSDISTYNNSDIFSDFDGNFFLRKVGTTFTAWVQVLDSKFGAVTEPICKTVYHDDDNEHNFALASIACQFAKHTITEDRTKSPHSYRQTHMACNGVKMWEIIDGGNGSKAKPQIIAHKGDNVIIDTKRMKVYLDDGTDLTKYASFGSNFPSLIGGRANNVSFYPNDADVYYSYIPHLK